MWNVNFKETVVLRVILFVHWNQKKIDCQGSKPKNWQRINVYFCFRRPVVALQLRSRLRKGLPCDFHETEWIFALLGYQLSNRMGRERWDLKIERSCSPSHQRWNKNSTFTLTVSPKRFAWAERVSCARKTINRNLGVPGGRLSKTYARHSGPTGLLSLLRWIFFPTRRSSKSPALFSAPHSRLQKNITKNRFFERTFTRPFALPHPLWKHYSWMRKTEEKRRSYSRKVKKKTKKIIPVHGDRSPTNYENPLRTRKVKKEHTRCSKILL